MAEYTLVGYLDHNIKEGFVLPVFRKGEEGALFLQRVKGINGGIIADFVEFDVEGYTVFHVDMDKVVTPGDRYVYLYITKEKIASTTNFFAILDIAGVDALMQTLGKLLEFEVKKALRDTDASPQPPFLSLIPPSPEAEPPEAEAASTGGIELELLPGIKPLYQLMGYIDRDGEKGFVIPVFRKENAEGVFLQDPLELYLPTKINSAIVGFFDVSEKNYPIIAVENGETISIDSAYLYMVAFADWWEAAPLAALTEKMRQRDPDSMELRMGAMSLRGVHDFERKNIDRRTKTRSRAPAPPRIYPLTADALARLFLSHIDFDAANDEDLVTMSFEEATSRVVTIKLESFKDTQKVIDFMLEKRIVEMDVTDLDFAICQRIVDMVSGASYYGYAKIERIRRGKYRITPASK